MASRLLALLLVVLSGCATLVPMQGLTECNKVNLFECVDEPEVVQLPTYQELLHLPPAESMPVVAVYAFTDQTGQRARRDGIADFSSAVTQGADTMLIDALKAAGGGTWFRVVERAGIDHLTRERQIVRQTRDAYNDDAELAPLLFAGIILEGGIIGYDSNIETGGNGARYLGVGFSQAYRRDIVTTSLRAVSTSTGEILLNVQTSKTILSVADGGDVFKFIDMDTRLVEIESGMTENESVTRAVRYSIEAAVLELIKQGDERGYWKITTGEKDEINH